MRTRGGMAAIAGSLRLTCLVFAGAMAAAAAPPTADATWQGTLHCDVIPGLLTKPLVQPFQLDVRGGVAQYQRSIRMPDTAVATAFSESGTGRVAADGRLTLRGSGMTQTSSYEADYSGILPEGGGLTTLTGAQHWRFPRHAPFDRPCDIALRRVN